MKLFEIIAAALLVVISNSSAAGLLAQTITWTDGISVIYSTDGITWKTNGAAAIAATTTNTVLPVLGAGSGSTNYALNVFTNSCNEFVLGSSNVLISDVRGTVSGAVIRWAAYVTNLSASTWGIRFSAGTNRWFFLSPTGLTNAPTVLTNNTRLELIGRSEGTNTLVRWAFYRPGL